MRVPLFYIHTPLKIAPYGVRTRLKVIIIILVEFSVGFRKRKRPIYYDEALIGGLMWVRVC